MRTGGGAAAAENLLASTCYLSRCMVIGNWGPAVTKRRGRYNGTALGSLRCSRTDAGF